MVYQSYQPKTFQEYYMYRVLYVQTHPSLNIVQSLIRACCFSTSSLSLENRKSHAFIEFWAAWIESSNWKLICFCVRERSKKSTDLIEPVCPTAVFGEEYWILLELTSQTRKSKVSGCLTSALWFRLAVFLSFSLHSSFWTRMRFHVQHELWKCWDVFLIWIYWKLKDFQITWANILFTIEHREHKCLNWEILHFYPLNELILNLIPATGLKKVGTGATKG